MRDDAPVADLVDHPLSEVCLDALPGRANGAHFRPKSGKPDNNGMQDSGSVKLRKIL